jgi:exodeoxyribonuclease V alpha subunit
MNNEIFGYIDRITYQNPENGFTVAQLKELKKSDVTCIVGFMPTVQAGETIRCQGHWKSHLVYGQQFEVEKHQVEVPADVNGIQKYLGSGLIKGVGATYAKRIVEEFGVETLHIIDTAPARLKEVKGLGKKRIEQITSCWAEQKSIRQVMIFLQSHGVSPTYAQKIFKTYGSNSIQVVKENPYTLARDIFGIGFKTADVIAQKIGMSPESPFRIEAGLEYVLSELSSNGHVCYPLPEFLKESGEILQAKPDLVLQSLELLKNSDRVEIIKKIHEGVIGEFIWKKSLYISESGISREIKRITKGNPLLREINSEKAIEWVQQTLKIELGKNQKVAVANSVTDKMCIITGGPGTGKSTITKAILSITEKLTTKILLAAPTGRAAKRMTEITGKKAATIHSLLEYSFTGGFKKNRETPLECDLIIVDEASMIDTYLMYSLLRAIPSHARVIFVGDINQLPSVGPGNVLKDIISSRAVPVIMLNEIYRQAAGSDIIINAHKINQGIIPTPQNNPESDFFFMIEHEPENILKSIISLVGSRLPKKYGFHPFNDIQVLAPMKKGIIGTENINVALQEALNPKNPPLFRNGKRFAIGDKVMQLKNNYDKAVFNGDIGRILDIDHAEQEMVVTIDEREVIYEFSDLEELTLAYAISVHKFQGSECPCIVMPVHTTHFKLLHRNLIYTGVTRGKKLVVLLGTKKAMAIAVKNDEVKQRYTGLLQFLQDMNSII